MNKQNLQNLLSAVIAIIFFTNCNGKPKTAETEILIPDDVQRIVIDNPDNMEHIDISPFLDSVKYVKLELTDESMIGKIRKLSVYKDRIYIMDDKVSTLFVFDINGKYQSKISKLGQGPGEYTYLDFFDIDYDNEQILLTDLMDNWVYRYDMDGNFINRRKIPIWNYGVAPGYDKGLVVFASFSDNRDKLDQEYNLVYLDSLMNMRKAFMPYNSSNINKKIISSEEYVFYPYNGHFYFFTIHGNNIYRIDKDNLVLKYTFDFGPKSYDLNLAKTGEEFKTLMEDNFSTISLAQETDEILSFRLNMADFPIYVQGYYSKESGNILCSWNYFIDKEQFNLFPKAAYESWLIAEFSASELISWRERAENTLFENKWLSQKKEFVRSLDSEDNPVLVFYKLKKF